MKPIRLLLVAVLLGWSTASFAQTVSLMTSIPTVDQVMDGSETSFALRFNQPVDHVRSRLILVTPQGELLLQPRRETEPNTLFSPVGRLPPGVYQLRWEVVEMHGAVARGTIPFSVVHR